MSYQIKYGKFRYTDQTFQRSEKNGSIVMPDKRSSEIVQRQIKNKIEGNSRFSSIASDMGLQYGVDTSGLHFRRNSPLPTSLNAVAAIQGNQIHFGPGQDTEYNIRHEVAHAIDNTVNGVPKGDHTVKGYLIDSSRENVVEKMVSKSLQSNPTASISNQQAHSSLQRLSNQWSDFPVTQLLLKKDKLNVVGENHPISGFKIKEDPVYDQKELEMDYCRRESGSDSFWGEKDFTTREGETADPLKFWILYRMMRGWGQMLNDLGNSFDWDGFWTNEKNKEKRKDDLNQENYNNEIQYIDHHLKYFLSIEDSVNKLTYQSTEVTKKVVEAFGKMQVEIQNYRDYLVNNFGNLRSLADEKLQKSSGMNKFLNIGRKKNKKPHPYDAFYQTFKKEVYQYRAKFRRITTEMAQVADKAVADVFQEYGIKIETNVTSVFGKDFAKIKATNLAISELRSRAMFNAANDQANMKGVWKIGDAHINDFKNGLATDNTNYSKAVFNIVTAKEFYTDFFNKNLIDLNGQYSTHAKKLNGLAMQVKREYDVDILKSED